MLPNNYWDINDILMSEEQVNCQLTKDCPFLSLLTQKNEKEEEAYTENEEIKLPISLACPLAEDGVLSIEVPTYLSKEYYNILQADPRISDMSGKNKYFYEKCLLMMRYVLEEDNNDDDSMMDIKRWTECLKNTLFNRFLYYFKNSQNIQIVNTNIHRRSSFKEMKFFEDMVRYNNNIKFFKENYSNNNKILDEKLEAKKMRMKFKKVRGKTYA